MNASTSLEATKEAVGSSAAPLPLRQRRQQELRQQLSDVATQMFLEHGFEAVRVADVARACGVTEKTVFNHFPTKESLLSDRWDTTIQALRTKLAAPLTAPVDAALEVLETELAFLMSSSRQPGSSLAQVSRFGALVRATPSLLAHQRGALDRLCDAAAVVLAARSGSSPEDPEPLISAAALTGLWTVFFHSLQRHLPSGDPSHIQAEVKRDLRRAAVVLRRGLENPLAADSG
ncbi:TetR/AcrR family transcriptional regulator [Deinococcus sp.]|uniref:TetR/AcrR family transcriptional regulator n=1 Tax=Deinococcus sp. TaxID=47478 RepID=UPI003CC5A29C